MKKRTRVQRILEPGMRLFFLVLILFAVATAFFEPIVAACEFAAVILLYIGYARSVIHRRRNLARYFDQIADNLDSAAKDSVINYPLPMVVVRVDTGEILWCNARFTELTGEREHLFEIRVSDMIPGFDLRWLLEGKGERPGEVTVRGRVLTVTGNIVRSGARDGRGLMGTLYFHDMTELVELRREAALSRTVVSILLIDNFDEIMKNVTDAKRSNLHAAIDEKVSRWADPAHGILRKYDRDKYLFVFEERHLAAFQEKRFAVLEDMREITGAGDIPVTLSIGIGRDCEDLSEAFTFASLAIDMALSRGGDQAVVKHRYNFEFFGGHSKEVEKRTKVKSRIMANTLARLVTSSSKVMVMGHAGADIDSVGAAAGVVCVARKCGTPAFIVVEENRSPARRLIGILRAAPEYQGVFIDSQTALLHADAETLLVIVDCNRPEIVESPPLLQTVNRVAVIDHHRRAATYIDNADLNFHEPYASSTCELVAELMRYICEPGDITRAEAGAMLAGIVLDTKDFALHTGVSTFEAAAFLRGAGADTIAVKKLFQNDLDSTVLRHAVIREARMVGPKCAMSVMETPVDRTVAAQAADELLTVSGVAASFVVFPAGDRETAVCARSLGDFNVQVICEKLGGGGHQAMAGAQLKDADLHEVSRRLVQVIESIYAEN
ncbi:MAG: DHH family phosphoesterase [Oscillospiraceae bacterium]|nr:DHH family phosphoesterase [Oscillospiraceae bacterium]